MRRAACLLALLAACATAALAQVPAPAPPGAGMPRDVRPQQKKTGTAVLSGRVVAGDSGKPLRRALIRISGSDVRDARGISTDADGRWRVAELPAGRYTIVVTKGGYVTLSYGQQRPFEQGKPVEVADGQVVEKLDVTLPRGSVISGRIADEFGEPLAGIRVAAMRYQYFSGRRRLMNVTAIGASDLTDDIGQYRLHGLSPGDYYVVASLGLNMSMEKSDDRTGYAPTYYPGTPVLSEAQRVTVGEGQEAAAVGFALEPVKMAKISGTAMNSQGKPLAYDLIVLTSPAMSTGSPLTSTALIMPDGTFTFSNVSPGDYVIQTISRRDIEAAGAASRPETFRRSEVALLPITVSGTDISGLTLVTAPTGTARGKIEFEGGTPPGVSPGSVTILMIPTAVESLASGMTAQPRDDWSFEVAGLFGKRVVRTIPPPGWFLKSIVLGGADVTDAAVEFRSGEETAGLEITLTQKMSSLTGTVLTAKGQPTSDYVVVVFASDPAKWGWQSRLVQAVRPDQSGTFVAKGLPAGEYLAVALRYLEPGEESDSEVLERLRPLATRVALEEGEAKSLELKIK